MSGWRSVQQCEVCWQEDNPDRTPTRVTGDEAEVCVDCGRVTTSGIWVRRQVDQTVDEYIARYFDGDREAYLQARRVFANERVAERGDEG